MTCFRLPSEVLTAVKNLYCKLLDSAINDARKGRSTLAPLLENFSYTLIKDKPCPPVTANDVSVSFIIIYYIKLMRKQKLGCSI